MKKRMEQLANGKFEYRIPELILSKKEITVTLPAGENCQGELYLGTQENKQLRGFANSTHRRLVLSAAKFSGISVRLLYGVDTAGLLPGERFSGEVVLSTNIGEYRLPFSIQIKKEQVKSQRGEITDLSAFTDLAKRDFKEAFRLFTSEGFLKLLVGKSPKTQALYLGVTKDPITYQHLEEFLIGAGKKRPVHISLKEQQTFSDQIRESRKEAFLVQRSGWGYLRLEVECQGDFLEVPRRTITQEDFIGSTYALEYIIRQEVLGQGRHQGQILVKGPYETLRFTVTATKNSDTKVHKKLREKQYRLALLLEYKRWALGKCTEADYLTGSFHIIRQLKESGIRDLQYQYWEAYLYDCRGEREKARDILKRHQDKYSIKENPPLTGAFLYLAYRTGLLVQKSEVCQRLRSLYQQKRDSFALLWMLLQVDDEFLHSPSRAVFQLEQQFELGCKSPFLYLEAWRRVAGDVTLLHRVDDFWTQVFLFAAKEGLPDSELHMRFVYLCGYVKKFSRSLYRALCLSYQAQPHKDTLAAICKYIMKENPTRREFFPWYALAVEKGLRITRLYEYYIETMDEKSRAPLPQALKMYLIYQNSLSDQKKAFVYANILSHRQEDPKTYAHYEPIMKDFALQKLREGKMNENYGLLYQEFAKEPFDAQEAELVGGVLFTYQLRCSDPKIRQIAVRHSQMDREEIYPCQDGVAYPRIYRKDAVILFIDEVQNRYAATVQHQLDKLIDEQGLLERCMEMEVTEPGFLLNVCQDEQITEENLEIYQRLVEQRAFSLEYKNHIRQKLLEYYKANPDREFGKGDMNRETCQDFARVDKVSLLEILISHRKYEEAYEIFSQYGGEGVAPESLLMLCSRRILQTDEKEAPELLSLAWEIFRWGKYDDVILRYLLKYAVASIDDLYHLWQKSLAFAMNTTEFEERLLRLLMFQWDYRAQGAQILARYVKGSGKQKVIHAYVSFASYGYFMKNQPLQPFVLEYLQKAQEQGETLDLICRLTLLESYASGRKWNAKQLAQMQRLLDDAIGQGLYFSFYRKLPPKLLAAWQLDDKICVEYRTDPRARVTLYYALDTGLGDALEYKSEPLTSVYEGVFHKLFTLFYGETLHYYFVAERAGNQQKSPEKTISVNRVDEKQQNKYQMLNKILAAKKLGKKSEVKQRLREYLGQKNYAKTMFQIEKE